MDHSEFVYLTTLPAPPEEMDVLMKAMWHIRNGNWDKAHDLVQNDPSSDAAWIHALIHKTEGDEWNAEYWYNRAGIKNSRLPGDKEWEMIVNELLGTARG